MEDDNRTVMRVEFDVPVPDNMTYDEVSQWVQFELCGGSIKQELLDRMGMWEPDPHSVHIDY